MLAAFQQHAMHRKRHFERPRAGNERSLLLLEWDRDRGDCAMLMWLVCKVYDRLARCSWPVRSMAAGYI